MPEYYKLTWLEKEKGKTNFDEIYFELNGEQLKIVGYSKKNNPGVSMRKLEKISQNEFANFVEKNR
jgi:uncharacterized protein YkuJ